MSAKRKKNKRLLVRAENPTGACGSIDHMTIDELKLRAVGDEFDGTCPSCGLFHLTREEIVRIEKEKITDSPQYEKLRKEAEGF